MTPLFIACQQGREPVARLLLLERGAAVDQANNCGTTPLSIACEKGHEPVARLLLERGAAVDQADNRGWTPLLVACEKGHEPVARLLLERGAAVDNGFVKQHPFTEPIMALLSREEERERKTEEERERKAEQERKADCMATALLAAEDAEQQKQRDVAKRQRDKNQKKKHERRQPASSSTPQREREPASSSTPPQTERERERQRIFREGQAFEYAPWCEMLVDPPAPRRLPTLPISQSETVSGNTCGLAHSARLRTPRHRARDPRPHSATATATATAAAAAHRRHRCRRPPPSTGPLHAASWVVAPIVCSSLSAISFREESTRPTASIEWQVSGAHRPQHALM